MKRDFRIYPTPEELAEDCAVEFADLVRNATRKGNRFSTALSGGNTPKHFFSVLAEKYAEAIDWNFVHFFWGDERCVPPDDPESNYGSFRDIFLGRIAIPCGNIHRIHGEDDPAEEALRYSKEISDFTVSVNSIPVFDLTMLGLGEDGHTASIFPGNLNLLNSDHICEVAVHPVSGQKRVTITGKVINNSQNIVFIAAGENKASIVAGIIKELPAAREYPASYIIPVNGKMTWMLDKKAARQML